MTKHLSILICLLLGVLFLCDSCREAQDADLAYIPGSYRALELWDHQRSYPKKIFSQSGYSRAYHEHQAKFLNIDHKAHDEQWEAMGPLNTSGRTLTVAINPLADSTIYAGSASGGLWRSRRLGLGESWKYVNTGFPVLGVSTIEFNPLDSMVMYIGTGEVYNYEATGTDGAYRSTRGSYGIGILKSIDGGITWEKSLDWSYRQQHGVWMVKVAPTDVNVVYAATTDGIYKSLDAGSNWTQVNSTIMGTDIEIDPRDPNKVLASFGNFGSEGNGIYYTEDGGETWNSSLADFGHNGKILLARSPSRPDIVYASVGNGFGFDDGATTLLRSDDGGKAWEVMNESDYSKWQGWFSHDIAVNPNDPSKLVAVGIEVWKGRNNGRTLEQKNVGGVTLTTPPIEGPDGSDNYVHSDIHFVTYHPRIRDLVIFGTDGGVFLSRDEAETFRSANGGYQTTQFYNGFSVSATNSDLALGGLQDNSTAIFRGTGTWQRAVGGDGSWTGINQANDDILYGSSQNLRISRSNDNGVRFNVRVSPEPGANDSPLFISPYVVARSSPDIMYAGTRYVYKSEDGGLSWTITNDNEFIDSGNAVFALAVNDLDPSVVYAATVPENTIGGVFVSLDGGLSWTGNKAGLPNRVPNDIAIVSDDPSMAFVTYSGFGTAHLFVTEDYGANWTPYDTGLPDVPGNAIAIDAQEGYIYFGNDISVYTARFRNDNGSGLVENPEWSLYATSLPPAAIIMDLTISESDRKLWAATHGNGSYRADLITEPVSVSETQLAQIEIYPNPTNTLINISGKMDSWQLYDIAGKLQLTGRGTQVNVEHLASGSYFLQMTIGGRSRTEQIIVTD